ncbi:MAG: class I SAM-dependent DNA methyltransferase, partial [Sphingomonadaceae bacterium]|nr:class I SAM-dependent DNA methyltransferase [Sphingomonadaceae bacterium]
MTIDELLNKWLGTEGGAERANYQMFLTELAEALDLPRPHPKGMGLGEYEFEAPVRSEAVYGGKGTKRIDLYKRDHFILEAKQSQLGEGEVLPDDPAEEPLTETEYNLFGEPVGSVQRPGKRRRRYDRLMEGARLQAQRYALALPEDHDTPPFLIVADIGRAFELYFDYAGNGRGYRPFPDERGYRIALADLASDAEIAGVELTAAETLRAIWTDPASIDPRTRAARVTRDIATLLSRVAKQLEEDQRRGRADDEITALGIEATSLFLMRTLFCMFAEDVELLPKDSFKRFLSDAEGRSDQFWRSGLNDLWHRMNDPQPVNRYWSHGDAIVRYFNGNLFSGAKVYDLPPEGKNILRIAADQDWRAVEPAIFGTLLEQALTSSERAKLGAHYTPRPYVQRLVQATMMDVLEEEWAGV